MDSIPQDAPKKHCPNCDRYLPETSQYWHRKGGDQGGFRVPCKSCRHDDYLAHSKEIIQQHRDAFFAKSPEEQAKIRDRWNKHYRERSVEKRQIGMCSKCLARPAVSGRFICDQCHADMKRWSDQLRDETLDAYGGRCVQCGEAHREFLTIDHIDNGGADHRRSIGGGHRLYRWLRKSGFPQKGFQLLCGNCNWLRHVSRKQREVTYMKIWYANLRQETLVAYGGKCSCCGEDRPEVLTVDHVNNNGAQHRRQVGAGGRFYGWLRKQGFPQDDYALLCFNCNRARYFYGVCPHQQ